MTGPGPMRTYGIDPAQAAQLDARWATPPWRDGAWSETGGRVGARLIATLRTALTRSSPAVALGVAWSAARGESPMDDRDEVDAFARAALAWAMRQLACGPDHADTKLACEIAVAAAALAPRHDPIAPGRMDRIVPRARARCAAWPHEGLLPDVSPAIVAAFSEAFRHSISLLVSTDRTAEASMRAVVLRADRALHARRIAAWTDLARADRARIASRLVFACGDVLARCAVDALQADEARRDDDGWLARTAVRIDACGSQTYAWLHEAGRDDARQAADGTDPEKTPMNHDEASDPHATSLLTTLEHDAGDAAWRTAGSQFVKLAREPLIALLSRHLSPDDASFRARAATFLETPIGTALLASVLSMGLAALPAHAGRVPQRLARELRVRAMSDAGDLLAELLTGPLRQVMALYLADAQDAPLLATPAPAALAAAPSRDATQSGAPIARSRVAAG